MKINLDSPPEEVQIQIIPLIDVIFCILTFFILAALQLTRQQAIDVDLPKASTATTQMREMLVVTVSATGQTFVDKQFVDRAQLLQKLQDYHTQNPEGLLVLNAAQTAFYNDIVQVLDLMRQVGGDRVALATESADASSTPGATPAPTASPTAPANDPFNLYGSPSPSPQFNPNEFQFPTPGQPATGQPSGRSNTTAPTPRTSP